MPEEDSKILTVGEFFSSKDYKELHKPDYQRPYEWTEKHVRALLDDLLAFRKDDANGPDRYRLGCVILHKNTENHEVVDGQQRLITLWLIRRCHNLTPGYKDDSGDKSVKQDGNPTTDTVEAQIGVFPFPETSFGITGDKDRESPLKIACKTITEWRDHHPFDDWKEIIACLDKDPKGRKAELVIITVDKIEEAFQLFDSQNSRGRPLDVHNFLKAHHLRHIEQNKIIKDLHLLEDWDEQKKAEELKDLFEQHIFKIGEWIHGRTRTSLTTENMDQFFGFNQANPPYKYQSLYSSQRSHTSSDDDYFELTAPFRAGLDFFQMVKYFKKSIKTLRKNFFPDNSNQQNSEDTGLNEYLNETTELQLRYAYSKELFLSAALLYINRFNLESLQKDNNQNAKIILAWALAPRLAFNSLRRISISKFAVGKADPDKLGSFPAFERLSSALTPDSVITEMYIIANDCLKKNKNEDRPAVYKNAIKSLLGKQDDTGK